MLRLSGIATKLDHSRAGHWGFPVWFIHGPVYVSSPKYHAWPVESVDWSVNVTVSGAVPDVSSAMNAGTGFPVVADTCTVSRSSPRIIHRVRNERMILPPEPES
jgi:hypothetical protein